MDSIAKFLADLGFPLHNPRWSWGSHSNIGILLTTWEDDLDETGRFVRVLGRKTQARSLAGLNERLDHLRILWSGGLSGYAVLAAAEDTKAQRRKIQSYSKESVRTIISLSASPGGSVWAELGEEVPVEQLKKHSRSHRLLAGEGAFPIPRPSTKVFKNSSATYIAKLPAIRQWLIAIAKRAGTVTYAEARSPFGLRSLEHRHAMDRIGHECLDAGEPILTSLIVDEKTGRCSTGFAKEFRRDDVEERKDCYAFWSLGTELPSKTRPNPRPALDVGSASDDLLGERAARFAKIAVRPEQVAFRRRVFLAHSGACVVTGCKIPEALDAAHRQGRSWRLGHNSGVDGLLLRKDIHALYDAQLVSFDEHGKVSFHPDVASHYLDFLR